MRYVAGGIVALIGAALFFIWWQLYRLALRILRDPDTEKLLDGE